MISRRQRSTFPLKTSSVRPIVRRLESPPLSGVADFQPYLEATVKSSERTRSLFLAMLLVVVLCVCTQRTVTTDGWQHGRIDNMKIAIGCWSRDDQSSQACRSALAYVDHFGMRLFENGAKVGQDSPQMAVFIKQDQAFLQLRTDSTKIPIQPFGASLDVNDLWLFFGAGLTTLMLMSHYSLVRERSNLRRCSEVAPNTHCIALLLMGQLLAPPDQYQIPKVFRQLLYMLPVAVYGYIWYSDLVTLNIGTQLVGDFLNYRDFIVETLFVVPLALLSVSCYRISENIQDIFDGLRESIRQAKE